MGDARGAPPSFSPEFVEAFRLLFGGRSDVHGQPLPKSPGGRVTEQVTDLVLLDHLRGVRRIGIYPIAGATLSQVKWGCIDLDVHDWDLACIFAARAKHYDLECLSEKTKGKGWHLWFFFVGWVDAWKVQLVLKQVVDDVGADQDARLIERTTEIGAHGREIKHPPEVNPKQPRVEAGGYGNYVNLPLFGGDVPDGRTCFYRRGPSGEPELIVGWTPHMAPLNKEAALNDFVEVSGAKPRTETTVTGYESQGTTRPIGTRQYSDPLPCALRVLKDGIGQGGRAVWAFRLPIHLKHMRWSESQAQGLMERWNEKNAPPLEPKELHGAVRSAYNPKNRNESFGCEDPIVAQFCALRDCPIYRKNHPEQEEHAPETKPSEIDPTIPRQITFNENTLEFTFARADLTYRVNGIDNRGRKAQAHASVTIHKAGKLVTTREMNLESPHSRNSLDKEVFEKTDSKVTGVGTDVMNISFNIAEELAKLVKKRTTADEAARQVVLSEKDMADTTAWMQAHPRILYDVIESTSRWGVAKEKNNKATLFLIYTSRLMDKPICAIGKGDSSAGKSYIASTILKLMPEEDVVEFTRITPSALFYRGENSMRWKILFIREAPGGEEAEHSLRTFMSEGDLILSTVQKDESTGKNRTEDVRVRGPICFYTTTTQIEVNDENETRLFTVTADATQEMTRKVNETTAYKAQFGSIDPSPEELKKWRDFQRMLKRGQEVVVPYASKLLDGFPTENIRSRRDFARLIELIKACAFVHQFHRTKDQAIGSSGVPKDIIIASVADYEIVKLLVQESIMRTSHGIKPGQEAFLHAIDEITETALEQDRNGKAYPRTTVESLSGKENDSGNIEAGTKIVWIESTEIRAFLGKTQTAVTRLIRALEADGVLIVMPKKTPLRVRPAADRVGDDGLTLPTIKPELLYEQYPEDRKHSYDPLSAPDFADLYGDSKAGWKRKENATP